MSRLARAFARTARFVVDQLPLLAFVAGVGLVVWGVWLYSMEIALIVAGVVLAVCAVLYERVGGPWEEGPE